MIDGFPNFFNVTRDGASNSKKAILESGINAFASISAVDGVRRPAMLLRSSPDKAGSDVTPWADVLDLASATMTYFGDHKATTSGLLGSTKGNGAFEESRARLLGDDPVVRAAAPVLLVFVTARWIDWNDDIRLAGAVRFLGPAVVRSMTAIDAEDPNTGKPYPNYQLELSLISWAAAEGQIDWRWINDRKDPTLDLERANRHAPDSWRAWVGQ